MVNGLEENAEKTKYLFKTDEKNAGENHVKVGKSVTNFKCIGTAQTNGNCSHD